MINDSVLKCDMKKFGETKDWVQRKIINDLMRLYLDREERELIQLKENNKKLLKRCVRVTCRKQDFKDNMIKIRDIYYCKDCYSTYQGRDKYNLANKN